MVAFFTLLAGALIAGAVTLFLAWAGFPEAIKMVDSVNQLASMPPDKILTVAFWMVAGVVILIVAILIITVFLPKEDRKSEYLAHNRARAAKGLRYIEDVAELDLPGHILAQHMLYDEDQTLSDFQKTVAAINAHPTAGQTLTDSTKDTPEGWI